MFNVLVEAKNTEPRTIRCLHNECGIGRGDDNLVILQGWSISRRHATIKALDAGIFIESLAGRGGVRVNGATVKEQRGPLGRNDVVEIGEYRITITSELNHGDRAATKPVPVAGPAAGAHRDPPPAPAPAAAASSRPPAAEPSPATSTDIAPLDVVPDIVAWRERVHLALVRQMDLRRVDVRSLSDQDLRRKTAELIEDVIDKEFDKLPKSINRRVLSKQVLDEAIGLGPLESLLEDNTVTEIMVNAADQIYIERSGRIQKSEVFFTNDRAVLSAIERIVAPLGRRIDESSPMVDARLKDGSR